MINIPHLDLKIWNPEQRVIEILSEFHRCGRIDIEIDREGSDCDTLGLYQLLDQICSTFNVDPSLVTIHTCNQLEHSDRYRIIKHAPLYIDSGQQFARQNPVIEKHWDTLKHFGLFVGRSSWQRLWMASYVWKHHRNSAMLTYHYDSAVDYHRTHLSFDELAYQIGLRNTVDLTSEFLRQLPIKNDTVNQYPILTPAHFAIAKLYPDFFVEIVCETFLSGRSFYPTEKTWRPLICQTPFLMLGPKNFLANLRKLGFKTFSQWWDESYDEDADLDQGKVAIRSIQCTVDRLSKLSLSELEAMYIDMSDTLKHNREQFKQLDPMKFRKIWP